MTDSIVDNVQAADPDTDNTADSSVVHASVDIAAPLAVVFAALLDPAELATWWGSADSYRTHDWEVDVRVGGKWSARTVNAAGEEASVGGEYLVVDEPRLLEYTWRASWNDFAPTTVRYELSPAIVDGGMGTRLTVTHTGFYGFVGCASSAASRMDAWNRAIEGVARSAMLYPVLARAA